MTAPGFCPCSDHPHVWNATWCYREDRPIFCPHEPGECPNRKGCHECGWAEGHSAFCPQHPEDTSPAVVPTGTGWPVP